MLNPIWTKEIIEFGSKLDTIVGNHLEWCAESAQDVFFHKYDNLLCF